MTRLVWNYSRWLLGPSVHPLCNLIGCYSRCHGDPYPPPWFSSWFSCCCCRYLCQLLGTEPTQWKQTKSSENLTRLWTQFSLFPKLMYFLQNYKNIVIVALHHMVASNYTKFWSNLINQARFIHKPQTDYEFHTSSSEYVQFFLRKVRAVLSRQDLAAATWDSTCGSWSSRTGIGRPLLTKLSRASRYG